MTNKSNNVAAKSDSNVANELADALRNMVGAFDSPVRCLKFPTEFGDAACASAREALAEHDAQPAPAPVQADAGWLRMTRGARDIQARHLDNHQGDVYHAMQSLVAKYGAPRTGPMIQERSAHPPAPAADGAVELPPPSVKRARVRYGEFITIKGLYSENEVRAAIAALRQPVPDAVRELPGKWREEADANEIKALEAQSVGSFEDEQTHDVRMRLLRRKADQLESALASQQESRNAD